MKKILTLAAILALCAGGLKAQVILQDNFPYANGVTPVVSGGLWVVHSGSAANSFVNNNHLEVFGTRGDDVNRPFTNTLTSTIAYASFIVNSTNLSSSTNYFAHFMVNNTTFRGKVFAAGLGAAPNTWRLGVSAAGNAGTQVIFPLDLATNVDYRVLISYDTVNFLATLWVDPVGSSDANIQSTDGTSAGNLVGYGFRQSSPNPNLEINGLLVGNSFADTVGTVVKPPTIYYQPVAGPTTNFVGGNLTLYCVGGGAGTVSFQWQKGGVNLSDDGTYSGTTSGKLSITSATLDQTGNYTCVVTSTTNSIFAGSVTSIVSQVVISVAPVPPTITTQPATNNPVYAHSTVVLHVVASGPPSFSYQWFQNNNPITDSAVFSGTATDTLTVSDITSDDGTVGTYRVEVTNPYGTTSSSNAVISVTTPATVSIGYLRTLVDPVTLTPTNSSVAYQVTGVITTYTNITSGNTASYWLQDGTGGINIFATIGSTFRPQQGDSVTYVGVLSSFTSGIELLADPTKPYTSYVINSSGNPLPSAKIIPFTLTNTVPLNTINTNLAGSLVTLNNVYFGASAGTAIAGVNVAVTNASGDSFYLSFFSQDLDTFGQILPDFASSVTGVLYGLSPNYTLAVTKFSDINTNSVTPLPIPLSVSYSGGTLTFNWSDPSFSLQTSTNVAGPYSTIPGASPGFSTNTMATPTLFFKLYHP